jgi:hypothetical protein
MSTIYVNAYQKPSLLGMLERPDVVRVQIDKLPHLDVGPSSLRVKLTLNGNGPRVGPKNERKVPHVQYESYLIGPRGGVKREAS